MAGHTPGPWRIVPYGDGDALVIHDARGDWRVCFMATPGSTGCMEGIEANARLIAAAPDLLEACKAAEDFCAACPGEAANAIYRQLHAAIAKVRGAA